MMVDSFQFVQLPCLPMNVVVADELFALVAPDVVMMIAFAPIADFVFYVVRQASDIWLGSTEETFEDIGAPLEVAAETFAPVPTACPFSMLSFSLFRMF